MGFEQDVKNRLTEWKEKQLIDYLLTNMKWLHGRIEIEEQDWIQKIIWTWK